MIKLILVFLIFLLAACDMYPESIGYIKCTYSVLDDSGCSFSTLIVEGQYYRTHCIVDNRVHLFPIDKCEVTYYPKK
jgi:hypothetical protein